MRKNIFFAFVGLLSGIGIFINDGTLGLFVLIAGLLLTLTFFVYKSPLIFISLGLMVGFFYSSFTFKSLDLVEKDQRRLDITIVDKRKKEDFFTYRVKAKDLNDGKNEKSVFYSDKDYQIGERFIIDAKIDLPSTNTNPYLFSYRSYLLSQRIKSELEIEKIYARGRSSSLLLKTKNKFYTYIHRIFDENLDKNQANFVSSVILGENLIDRTHIEDLGLSHILAVSGLHIDIMVGFILAIFLRLNLNYKYAYLTALGLCFFYGYLISFPFSVIRVLLMTFISYHSYILRKPLDKKKTLLLAGIFILLVNPFAILSPGFTLTMAAGAGIYLIYPKFSSYERGSYLRKKLIFALAIQLAVFPFIVYYYGRINLLSILANLLILPIFDLAMRFIFGLIIGFPIFKGILKPVFWILNILLGRIYQITDFLGYFSVFSIDFKKEHILLSIFLFVLLLILLYGRKSKKLMNKLYFGLCLILIGFTIIEPMVFKPPTFSMVDIGQGDAFILQDGKDTYLFDLGGPSFKDYDSGEKVLVPLLKAMGVGRIKGVFISHMDKDHAGNLEIIAENFEVDHVLSTYLNENDLKSYNFVPMREGDRVKLNNGYVEVVYDGVENEGENNKSLGLLINIRGSRILTLGDLEEYYEDKLGRKAHILKLSHHGSRTSTSKNFVEKVDPQVVLISAGKNNRYGHPHQEILENVEGREIYNTQDSGFVELKFYKDHFEIEAYEKGGFFR